MIGFAAGFAAGAVAYSKMTEEQRDGVADAVDSLLHRGRSGEITASVASGFGDVADAVTERVTDVADQASSTVAEKVDSDTPATTMS